MTFKMVETSADAKRHELLADVADQTARLLTQKHKLDPQAAAEVGNELADFLATHWNGTQVYINADAQYLLSKRDLEIFNRFKSPADADLLSREFGISFTRIYQINKRVLAAMRREKQPVLFPDPEPAPKHSGKAKLSTG